MTPAVSYSDFRKAFSYDPHTGIFRWRISRTNGVKVGDVAGTTRKNGCVVLRLNNSELMAHRAAWFYIFGYWPRHMIDHINGDMSDNRLCNLREATNSQNQQNLRKTGRGTANLIGVTMHKRTGKWMASIKVDGKSKYLGLHPTKEAAHEAYLTAKRVLHPYQQEPRQ